MRFLHIIVLAMAALICACAPACAEKRVALVIGNSKYTKISPLTNPANDARLMADTLRGLGFTLTGGGAQIDLDEAGLDRAVQAFGRETQNADAALFDHAGHGVELRGTNYLLNISENQFKNLHMADHAKYTGPAVEAHYQFLRWLAPTVEKFPKNHKFTVGHRIGALALDVPEALIDATGSSRRWTAWSTAAGTDQRSSIRAAESA